MDQPGKVRFGYHARGEAEQGRLIFPCPRSRPSNWPRETGSAVPSRVSLLISILGLNLVRITGFLPISAAASISLFKHS